MKKALSKEVPVMVWIGEEEKKNNQVKIKFLNTKEESLVLRENMVSKLLEFFSH
jgi:histidyl-tRNA synthetase